MLDYEEFTGAVENAIQDFLPTALKERGIEFTSVTANNGQKRDIVAPERINGDSVPVIYMDDVYDYYKSSDSSIETVCKIVVDRMEEGLAKRPGLSEVEEQMVPEALFAELINLESNRDYLNEVPHLVYGDLAVICKFSISTPDAGNGSVTVNNGVMNRLGYSEEALFNTAFENMAGNYPFYAQCMEDAIGLQLEGEIGYPKVRMDDLSVLPEDGQILVISNRNNFYGDGVLLMKDDLEKLADWFDSSVILLPSSVHEILAVKEESEDMARSCLEMVKNVNRTAVSPNERLSDNVYRFNRDTKELELYTQEGEVRDMRLEKPDEIPETEKKKTAVER